MSASPSNDAEAIRRALRAHRIEVDAQAAQAIARDWAVLSGFHDAMHAPESGMPEKGRGA